MKPVVKELFDLAKSVEPPEGFFGYFDLVDALEAQPRRLEAFKTLFSSADISDLEGIEEINQEYGWIVMGAADAIGCVPDDPRNFLPEEAVAKIPDPEVLGALCSACILNDLKTVRSLVERISVNLLDHNKQAPLGYAIGNGHIDCVRVLLKYGADPNLVQNWGNSQVHVCASTASSKDIFDLLIEAGGDVNVKNDEGKTVVDLLKDFGRKKWLKK